MRAVRAVWIAVVWLAMSASPAAAGIVFDPTSSSVSLSASAGGYNPSVSCSSADMRNTSGSVSISNQPCSCGSYGACSPGALDAYVAEGTYSGADGNGHVAYAATTSPDAYNAGCYGGIGAAFAQVSATAFIQFSVSPPSSTDVRFRFAQSGTGSGNGGYSWSARLDNNPVSWDWNGSRCYRDGCTDDPQPTLDETLTLNPGVHVLRVDISAATGGQCPNVPSGTAAGTFSFSISEDLCGNAVIDPGEQCDGGRCCTRSCTLRERGRTCRASAGECDAAEACDGTNPTCPADAVKASGSVCRIAAETQVCDVAELCDGTSKQCPPDGVKAAGDVCREAADVCDQPEHCDGISPTCPEDLLKRRGEPCREGIGACDVAETCDGVSAACPQDLVAPRGQTCRRKAHSCDRKERCTGASKQCPTDKSNDLDQDGICDRYNICGGAVIVDVDLDKVDDRCSLCVGGAPVRSGKLRLGGFATGENDDSFLLVGKLVFDSAPTISAIDDGATIFVSDQSNALFLIKIPPGPFDPVTGRGWTISDSNRTQTFTSATPIGGVLTEMKISSSLQHPEIVRVRATGAGGSYRKKPTSLPLGAIITFKTDGVCGALTFPSPEKSCRWGVGENTLTCAKQAD